MLSYGVQQKGLLPLLEHFMHLSPVDSVPDGKRLPIVGAWPTEA